MTEFRVSPATYQAVLWGAVSANWPLNAFIANRDASGYAQYSDCPLLGSVDTVLTCLEITPEDRDTLTALANVLEVELATLAPVVSK